jgi:endonuclease/exonuclease/phosphatase family metal-dependent hydrolase
MNDQLDSAIDHILINSSARRHYGENSFYIYRPSVETLEEYQQWRETYSDHFPLIFALEVRRDDDND